MVWRNLGRVINQTFEIVRNVEVDGQVGCCFLAELTIILMALVAVEQLGCITNAKLHPPTHCQAPPSRRRAASIGFLFDKVA